MAVNGRNKGRAFELQIAKLLQAELGIKFSRDLRQYQQSELGDLIADDPNFPFVIEAKRYANGTGCRPNWWAQACNAAEAVGKLPCVIYKYDRRDIRCVINMTAIYRSCGYDHINARLVEVDIESLCYIIREIMANDAGY